VKKSGSLSISINVVTKGNELDTKLLLLLQYTAIRLLISILSCIHRDAGLWL